MTRNIFDSFMSHWLKIYDHSKRGTQKPFMNIYGSLMIIYDPKKKVIHDKKNLCLIYVSLVENL